MKPIEKKRGTFTWEVMQEERQGWVFSTKLLESKQFMRICEAWINEVKWQKEETK